MEGILFVLGLTGCAIPFSGPTPSPYPASVGFTFYRFSVLHENCTTPWKEEGFRVYGWQATLMSKSRGRLEHRLEGVFLLVEQTDGYLMVPGLSLQWTYPREAPAGVEFLVGAGVFPNSSGGNFPLPTWLSLTPYIQRGPWRLRVKGIPAGLTVQYAPGAWDAFIGIHIPTLWMWFFNTSSADCYEAYRYRPGLTLGVHFPL